MIRIGLASSALRNSSVADVIQTADRALVDGIEWSADGHVPCGDQATAEKVLFATLRARLTVVSYATLVRIMPEDGSGVSFDRVLETGDALKAPALKVWGGDGPSASLDRNRRAAFIARVRRLADRSGASGITVLFAVGRDTFFDTYESALALCDEIAHPFVKLAWRPLFGDRFDAAMAGFAQLARATGIVYLRNMARDGTLAPLADMDEDLQHYLACFRNCATRAAPGVSAMDRFVVIDGFRGDDLRNLIVDAGLARDRAAKLEIMYRRYTPEF